jgi:hypothetical protein
MCSDVPQAALCDAQRTDVRVSCSILCHSLTGIELNAPVAHSDAVELASPALISECVAVSFAHALDATSPVCRP